MLTTVLEAIALGYLFISLSVFVYTLGQAGVLMAILFAFIWPWIVWGRR